MKDTDIFSRFFVLEVHTDSKISNLNEETETYIGLKVTQLDLNWEENPYFLEYFYTYNLILTTGREEKVWASLSITLGNSTRLI